MESSKIDITKIEYNKGQIDGIPANPRKISKADLELLKRSIVETPELLEARGILVYEHQGKYVAIGGNMRLKACRAIGLKEVPCVVIPSDISKDKLIEIAIKDNGSFGKWEATMLETEWSGYALGTWGVCNVEREESSDKEESGDKKRKAWGKRDNYTEPVCDLVKRLNVYRKNQINVFTIFNRSDEGIPFSEIKAPEHVKLFAYEAADLIKHSLLLGNPGQWALVTTPKRRHKDWNFSEEVCKQIAKQTGIEFVADVCTAKNKMRINAEYVVTERPPHPNLIVFDDIVTTGETLNAMYRAFPDKNLFFVVGIHND